MTPATLRLSLEDTGSGLTGSARLSFSQGGTAEASVQPVLQENTLTFSIRDPSFLETTVQFRAVLQAGSLHGVAFAEDPQGGRWYGSWTLTPEASGQSAKSPAR